MAYGIPKISSTELKKQILEAIGQELDKDVNIGQLSFYGAMINFSASLMLISRGEATVQINANLKVGDAEPLPLPEDSLEPSVAEFPKKTPTIVGGIKRIGRQHVAHKNPVSPDKTLESKPTPTEADKRTVTTLGAGAGATGGNS